ncbi:uncharacterized protein LACBIDRAFT_330290 [Laccaria bicolor S238N-H82]|uniref:Predicted protein n=1 Tax=Laccaria bicolor (strain S238N-H82 / ATCC MYA-4686) TaxID=486041 RepID=B0DKU0_LACBS|nr:uncharacterized protein LACBIDRAFT_330290 [Laccaria bicolor S238N-H82]EDR04706.1 predicted protein [Laccaria bicolor S238N-H82]|eukprot:XP_001884530.1 predicted protein [Laccaria bicolor S238N-H82]
MCLNDRRNMDEDDIRRSFRSHSALREQRISSDDIEHDIRSYLVKTFDNHLEKNPNFVRDRTLREEIIKTLVENAKGIQLLNIAEMGDDWDPDKTINDPSKLISGCGHLLSTTISGGNQFVALTHQTVQQFLTSDPNSLDTTTLPQYHCYPLCDAFMESARIFLKRHQIRGCPYLPTTWRGECELVNRWRSNSVLETSSSDFLSTVFNAPLKENARPGPSLVFPNATDVIAINCRFIDVEDEFYILTSSQPAEFSRGPYVLEDVFPRLTHFESTESEFWSTPSAVHLLHDRRATTKPVGYPFQTSATHVIVKDIDFIHATNSNWTIRPGVETIPGVVTLPEPQTIYFFASFINRNVEIWSSDCAFNEVTGQLTSVGEPDWKRIFPKLPPPQELARDPDECSTGTSISEDSVD